MLPATPHQDLREHRNSRGPPLSSATTRKLWSSSFTSTNLFVIRGSLDTSRGLSTFLVILCTPSGLADLNFSLGDDDCTVTSFYFFILDEYMTGFSSDFIMII